VLRVPSAQHLSTLRPAGASKLRLRPGLFEDALILQRSREVAVIASIVFIDLHRGVGNWIIVFAPVLTLTLQAS